MIENSTVFKLLIQHLQRVPYLASKNIYRVIEYLLTLEEERVKQLCEVIVNAKKSIIPCNTCFVWKEKEVACAYCDAHKRDKKTICVVETWQDLVAIEKTGGYKGFYHVLGGALCPLEGIGPENLTVQQLHDRIDNEVVEIILATNQTPEGEATAAYVAHKLQETHVSISCLSRGVPVGSSLAFMDRVTIYKALSDRRPF